MDLSSSQQTQSRIASMPSPSIFYNLGQIHLTVSPRHRCPPFLSESHISSISHGACFFCISQEWSHYTLSFLHAVDQTKCWAFVLKRDLTWNSETRRLGTINASFLFERILRPCLTSSLFIYSTPFNMHNHQLICNGVCEGWMSLVFMKQKRNGVITNNRNNKGLKKMWSVFSLCLRCCDLSTISNSMKIITKQNIHLTRSSFSETQ